MRNRLYTTLAVLFWLAIWQLMSMAIGQEILLVSPVSACSALMGMLGTARFYQAVLLTLSRILVGFLCALAVGTGLAALASFVRFVRVILGPPMAAISATPIASFVILALIFTGPANLSWVIALLMTLPVVYLNTLKGIESADRKLLEMAHVFRLSGLKKARAIYVPSAVPFVLSAARIAIGMCWKAGLAAEVIAQPKGSIGELLYRAKVFWATDEIFAWTIAIILISVFMEKLAVFGIGRLARRFEGADE